MRKSLQGMGSRLTAGLVVLAMGALGLIQYRWFDRAATNEMIQQKRNLRFTVTSVVRQQYREILPGAEVLFVPLLDDVVAETWTQPGVVIARGGTPPSVLGASPVLVGRTREAEYRVHIDATGEDPGDTSIFLEQRLAPGRVQVVRIELDQGVVFREVLAPALGQALPGYRITFSPGTDINASPPPPPTRTGYREPQPEIYRFRPLVALGRSLGVLPWETILEHPVLPQVSDLVFWRTGDELLPGSGVIRIQGGIGAAFHQAELRLALNWLLSLGLMALLTLAFVLVIHQGENRRRRQDQERDFVASVTHELRTPLTVLQSAADNLARGLVSQERIPAYGAMLQTEARRLGRMIEEVLAYSRLEGRTARATVLVPVDPVRLLEDLVPPLASLAQAQGVALVVDSPERWPSLEGNPEVLRLVLENLVVNALNHAWPDSHDGADPQEAPSLRVALRPLVPRGLELVVEDNGRGIARGEQRRVFEAFYRDTGAVSRQEKGSGLGLFLVDRHVRQSGGRISLESPWRLPSGIKKQGCRFVVRLFIGAP